MGQGWGIKVATKSLTRQRRLAPDERVLAYAVVQNLAPPFGRLDTVLTTEALFIGPNVQHCTRFALDDMLECDGGREIRFVTVQGLRGALLPPDGNPLAGMLMRLLHERQDRSQRTAPPTRRRLQVTSPKVGVLSLDVAFVGAYSARLGASIFAEALPAVFSVDEGRLWITSDHGVLVDTDQGRISFAAWQKVLYDDAEPSIMCLELGRVVDAGEERIGIAMPALGTVPPSDSDYMLGHHTAEKVLGDLIHQRDPMRPDGSILLPLLPN